MTTSACHPKKESMLGSIPLIMRVADTGCRMDFHIPPQFNKPPAPTSSPLTDSWNRKVEFPAPKGKDSKSKSWFVKADQAIEILQRKKSIGAFPR